MSSHSMVARARLAGRGALLRLMLAVAALSLAVVASPASAVTIGQTGFDNTGCRGDVAADVSYVVPAGGGVITSFSIASTPANAGSQLDFLVLRPMGGSNYLVVGHTGLVTLAGTPIETFPATIPVQAGDILGFRIVTFLNGCGRNTSANTVFFFGGVPPALTVGDTIILDLAAGGGLNLNLSANLVPPGPTSAAQCKKGGWKSFGDMFRNQGECVRLFEDDEQ